MATLSPNQVAGVIKMGGGPPAGTTVADWIAKADEESDYRTHADSGVAAGLWQINYKVHKQYSREELMENGQQKNWAEAKRLYVEDGWRPWNASGGAPRVNDAHRKAAENSELPPADGRGGTLDAVTGAAGAIASDPLGSLAEVFESTVGSVFDVLSKFTEFITDPNTWKRLALLIGGVGVGYIGVTIIARPVLDPAINAGVKAATKGKV